MWRPYLKVIAKKAPQAVHILDRFHIMSMLSKAIDKVRAEEAKQLRAQGYEPMLKGSRWLLLNRPENLTEAQEVKLAELVQYNLRSVRSYLFEGGLPVSLEICLSLLGRSISRPVVHSSPALTNRANADSGSFTA